MFSSGRPLGGGKRQRMLAADLSQSSAAEPTTVPYSHLATLLLESWAIGEVSACTLQRLAAAASRDGLQHPEIITMSAIGSGGRHASHCSRDLMRHFKLDTLTTPPTTLVQIPVVDLKSAHGDVMQATTEVQFPHDIFHHYAKNDPQKFAQVFGNAESIAEFWASQNMDDPKLWNHPLLKNDDFAAKCIPGKLHSDGVLYSNKHSLHTISVCSFLARGDVMETQLYFGSVAKDCCCNLADHGQSTIGHLFRMLAWSLAACLYGRHPILDWNNEPWDPSNRSRRALANHPLSADSFVFALIGICADLDELSNTYRLAHFNSNSPCFWCPANVSTMPWSDFSEGALWKMHCYTCDAEVPDHPVWEIPGLSVHSVLWDILHGLDLGPTQHVIGNVLLDLVLDDRFGDTMRERLRCVFLKIQRWYKELGIVNQLGNLTISMFSDEKAYGATFPRLHSKANEARHLLPCVLEILKETRDQGSIYEGHRLATVVHLCRFYAICENHAVHLPEASHVAAKDAIERFLSHYTWLNNWATSCNKLRWQVTIKFHYLDHVAPLTKFLNPKHGSCYPGESFVGKIARMAHAASFGKPAHALGRFIMHRLHMLAAIASRTACA
jgi:hypothetical protein